MKQRLLRQYFCQETKRWLDAGTVIDINDPAKKIHGFFAEDVEEDSAEPEHEIKPAKAAKHK